MIAIVVGALIVGSNLQDLVGAVVLKRNASFIPLVGAGLVTLGSWGVFGHWAWLVSVLVWIIDPGGVYMFLSIFRELLTKK